VVHALFDSTFHTFILPGLVRQVEAVHARGGYFVKHTDGNVLQPGTLLENYLEARQAVRDYGGSAV